MIETGRNLAWSVASYEPASQQAGLIGIEQGNGTQSIRNVRFFFLDNVQEKLGCRAVDAFGRKSAICIDGLELASDESTKQREVVFDGIH